jgi:hypothetical protein
MEWKHMASPIKKKFKMQPSAGKVILTHFWDSQGPTLEHDHDRDMTTINVCYDEVLWD